MHPYGVSREDDIHHAPIYYSIWVCLLSPIWGWLQNLSSNNNGCFKKIIILSSHPQSILRNYIHIILSGNIKILEQNTMDSFLVTTTGLCLIWLTRFYLYFRRVLSLVNIVLEDSTKQCVNTSYIGIQSF